MKLEQTHPHRPYGELQQGRPVYWLTRPPASRWLSLVRAAARHAPDRRRGERRLDREWRQLDGERPRPGRGRRKPDEGQRRPGRERQELRWSRPRLGRGRQELDQKAD